MSVETTVALSRHPMIAGLKDATGDNGRVSPMRSIIGDDFRLYSGAHGAAWCTAHGALPMVHGTCARRVHCCDVLVANDQGLMAHTAHAPSAGEDGMAREYVLQGGDGVISVTANVAPAAVAKVITSRPPLYLAYISPSPLYLAYISSKSPLNHQYTSSISPPHLPYISPTSPR